MEFFIIGLLLGYVAGTVIVMTVWEISEKNKNK